MNEMFLVMLNFLDIHGPSVSWFSLLSNKIHLCYESIIMRWHFWSLLLEYDLFEMIIAVWCLYHKYKISRWFLLLKSSQDGCIKKLPIMLCGNKTDMREESEQQGRKTVTYDDGQRLARVRKLSYNSKLCLRVLLIHYHTIMTFNDSV